MPLLIIEGASEGVRRTYEQDPHLVVWWSTEVECASALSRRERQEELSAETATQALAQLEALKGAWYEIHPADAVRRTARRILRVHDLRAGDALQIAAAIVAAEDHPDRLEVVTLDERMSAALLKEGFALTSL